MRQHLWIAVCASAALLAVGVMPLPAGAQDKPAAAGGDKKAEATPAAKKPKDRCKDGEPAEVASFKIEKGKHVDAAINKPLTADGGDAERGLGWMAHRRLGNCLACHEVTKVEERAKKQAQIEVKDLRGKTAKMPLGTHGHIGPTLDGVAERYSEGELRMLVVNPKKIFPDTIMPAFHRNSGFTTVHPDCKGLAILSAGQVEDVVAFLKTLK